MISIIVIFSIMFYFLIGFSIFVVVAAKFPAKKWNAEIRQHYTINKANSAWSLLVIGWPFFVPLTFIYALIWPIKRISKLREWLGKIALKLINKLNPNLSEWD